MGGSHPNGRLGMLDTGTAPHSLRVCWAAEPPPRYWGTSGHGTDIVIWSFLTHSGISRSPIPDLRTSARSKIPGWALVLFIHWRVAAGAAPDHGRSVRRAAGCSFC